MFKKRLRHGCFPVNFANFSRTPFLQSTSGRLLLNCFENFKKIIYSFFHNLGTRLLSTFSYLSTHFWLMFHFIPPKSFGFLVFSGGRNGNIGQECVNDLVIQSQIIKIRIHVFLNFYKKMSLENPKTLSKC